MRLNFCVRDGNRWYPHAIVTGNLSDALSTLKTAYPLTSDPDNFLRFLARARLGFSSALASLSSSPSRFSDQALDLLVSATFTHYCASSAHLSTLSSARGLTSSRCGNLYLVVCFTLRCLQRLSLPHFASLLCSWHYNSFTSDASIPVLSY